MSTSRRITQPPPRSSKGRAPAPRQPIDTFDAFDALDALSAYAAGERDAPSTRTPNTSTPNTRKATPVSASSNTSQTQGYSVLFNNAMRAYMRGDLPSALRLFEACQELRRDDERVAHNIQRIRDRMSGAS